MTLPANPAQRRRVAVLVSGRGSNLRALLDAQRVGRLPHVAISVVVSNVPGVRALDIAREFGVEGLVIDHRSHGGSRAAHEAAIVEALRSRRIDIVACAGYMRVFEGTLLDAFPGAIINIHPSLLPSFPGAHAHRDALDKGVRVSGCTAHFVTRAVDAGPIILQRHVVVHDDDTSETLAARILVEEHKVLPEALELLASGRLRTAGGRVFILPRPESAMPSLLLATSNNHKVGELTAILGALPVRIRTTGEFESHTEVAETGATYRDNALLKARVWHERTGLWTLADDSGLEVEALGGAPGLKSARYAATPEARISKLLGNLTGVPADRRRARFVASIALVGPNGAEYVTEGTCEGSIALAQRGEGGFGYDPIFVVDGYRGAHLAELSEAEKNRISHRARALEAMKPHIREHVR